MGSCRRTEESVSEAMCCPLSEADEYCKVWNSTTRKARKAHRCDECREEISVGARYEHISMLFDGAWDTSRLCLSCKEIGDHFTCGSRILGVLWDDLEENFFPDMRAGGQCLDGLSPEAKDRLFTRRLQWLFDSEREADGAPPPNQS